LSVLFLSSHFHIEYIEGGKLSFLTTLNSDFGKHKCRQIFSEYPTIFNYDIRNGVPYQDIRNDLEKFLVTIYSHGSILWHGVESSFIVLEKRGQETARIEHKFRIRAR
jgi:hypothetical protein